MDYRVQIETVKQELEELYSVQTIISFEERCERWTQLPDRLVSIIRDAITDTNLTEDESGRVYKEGATFLENQIGCADDAMRYCPIFEEWAAQGVILNEQLDIFNENLNLNLGRWY